MKALWSLAFGVLLGCGAVPQVQAKPKPKWELGIGHAEGQAAHYAGSNHYYFRSGTLPYGIYRLEQVDLGSTPKLYVPILENVYLEPALGFEFPVEAEGTDVTPPAAASDPDAELVRDKNYTRRGMANQQALLGIGAKLVWYANEHVTASVSFLLKNTLGAGFHYVGVTLRPGGAIDLFERESPYALGVGLSVEFGDQGFNEYYYGVPDADALSDRPAYDAPGGLIAWHDELFANAQVTEQFKVFGAVYHNHLRESVIRDSPLVLTKENRGFAWGFTYTFLHSSETVARVSK